MSLMMCLIFAFVLAIYTMQFWFPTRAELRRIVREEIERSKEEK